MTNPPAFQLYAGDFYMDTVEWSATQVGIYFRLLMYEWINGSLPDDCTRLARIAGIDVGNFKKCYLQDIARKFSPNGDGNLINIRLEQTREKQEEYQKSQREAGLRGVQAKKSKGIFPFNKSSNPLTNPSNDPASENQALQSSTKEEEKKESKKERKKKPSAAFSKQELKQIEKHCKTLQSHFKKTFWPWVQTCINKKYRADAIILALEELWKYRKSTKDPWPYLNQIVVIQHQNLNEAEVITKHEQFKKEEMNGSIPDFFK